MRSRGGVLAASLVVLLTAAVASAGSLEGTVVRIVDGDTIHVRVGDRVEKVRYIGVNTPEVHHPRKGEEPATGAWLHSLPGAWPGTMGLQSSASA